MVLPLLRDGAVDHVFAPPTVLAKIVGALEGERIDGIRTIFCGTAPLLPALYAKARAIFGPVVRVTYGKSEIVNPITVLPPAATDAYYAESAGEGVCVGWPGSRRGDRDSATRPALVLGADSVGEVHLRGRHMSCGHIDASGFQPLPEDGFHATGDLGRIDARGRLHLVGRLADVVKSGGYKIHPDEIERELAGTAGTAAVAIVSLPSEYWGEIIVAVAETDDARLAGSRARRAGGAGALQASAGVPDAGRTAAQSAGQDHAPADPRGAAGTLADHRRIAPEAGTALNETRPTKRSWSRPRARICCWSR